MQFLLDHVLPTLLPVAIGIGAWFATQFVGRQIVRFYDLKSDSVEQMYFYANLLIDAHKSDPDRYHEAYDALRRCAARFDALQHVATPLTRCFLNWRGYDLNHTVKGFTGFSNSLTETGYARAHQRTLIEIGLKLPRSYTSDELDELRTLRRTDR